MGAVSTGRVNIRVFMQPEDESGLSHRKDRIEWGYYNLDTIRKMNTNWDSYITFAEYCEYYNLSKAGGEKYRPNFEAFVDHIKILKGELDTLPHVNDKYLEGKTSSDLCREAMQGAKKIDRYGELYLGGAFFCRGFAFDTVIKRYLQDPEKVNQILIGFGGMFPDFFYDLNDNLPNKYKPLFVEAVLKYHDDIDAKLHAAYILKTELADSPEYQRLWNLFAQIDDPCVKNYLKGIVDDYCNDPW